MGLFDKNSLLDKVNKATQKVAQVNQQITEDYTQKKLNETPVDTQGHTMYEVFMPSFGAGKKFVFTENSLIIGGVEYPYSALGNITQVNPPTAFTDGVAQTTVTADGKELILGYNVGQSERFNKAMSYANEQIDQINGVTRDYKYQLNCGTDTKIEFYNDYLIFYRLKSGLTARLSNSLAGGTSGEVLMYSDIDIQLQNDDAGNTILAITKEQNTVTQPISADDVAKAQEIINFINQVKAEEASAEPEFTNELWKPIVASVREFPLGDKVLVVNESLDLFNSYRNTFRDIANDYSNAARAEYDKRVVNLMTYLEFFPKFYNKYLDALASKAMDILIAEGIYTATKETFIEKHLSNYHSAIDDFEVTLESINLTVQNNVSKVAAVTSFVPNLVGGGFGLKGAIKGIVKAEAFNLVRDGLERGLLNSVAQISQPQQAELFGRINPDGLFTDVYNDYWRVFLTIVEEFIANGRDVWMPSDEQSMRAKNIFSNMSNPNFPQDKKLEIFISILTTFPYSREYLQYMVNTYGDNEQTKAIRDYFGYTNFDDLRLGM